MSTDSSYLVSWSTVIYNDVIMPCLRKPLSEKKKLLTMRAITLLIGVFLVFYGLIYSLPGTAFDYIAITGTICVANTFTLLMGAIYMPWTNWIGASAAIVLGAAAPLSFVIGNQIVGPSYRIAPATAGLSAYVLAFSGLILGSLIGNVLLRKTAAVGEFSKAVEG